MGAAAPCQLTGNISTMMFYGNRSIQDLKVWQEVVAYLSGKVLVFSLFGLLVWLFGQTFEQSLTALFPIIRKVTGPFVIFIGLYLLGIIKMNWNLNLIKRSFFQKINGNGSSFLLGIIFTLGFCPTMFLLFFGLLMPLVLSSSYGIILPGIFALGTSVPFLLLLTLIMYCGLTGVLLKRSKKMAKTIQMLFGGLMIIVVIFDTFVYWS
ncbi:sulfite exporter TauE/SafE family protein [Fictibacillus nanhaiensis]|nr:sulfite exporter TauE/SafE family protein [Fictibacillus nanhaiensis]